MYINVQICCLCRKENKTVDINNENDNTNVHFTDKLKDFLINERVS